MEIENRFVVALDGSAVLKETIRVHKELLSFLDESGNPIMVSFLEIGAFEERAKVFHADCVLRTHSLKTLNGGGKLLEAEYFIPYLNNVNVINPYICFSNYKDLGVAKLVMFADLIWGGGGDGVGGKRVGINIQTAKRGIPETNFAPPSPIILQKFRNLQPVFKSLMKEFKISLSFESYAPVNTNYGMRDGNSRPRSTEMFSFSGADYDNGGGLLLDNDEIMQELLRQKFGSPNFLRAADTFVNNATVPIMCSRGSLFIADNHISGRGVGFQPSKKLFTDLFEGKLVGGWSETPILADFKRIGYDPDTDPRMIPKKEGVAPTEPAKTDKPVVEPAK